MNKLNIFNATCLKDIKDYQSKGFDIREYSNEPEKPGATLLHYMADAAQLDAIVYLIEEHGFDKNEEDLDECTPLGYLVNDELMWELDNGNVTTVNDGSENGEDIERCITHLVTTGAECKYMG